VQSKLTQSCQHLYLFLRYFSFLFILTTVFNLTLYAAPVSEILLQKIFALFKWLFKNKVSV